MMLSITASADYDLHEECFLILKVEPPLYGIGHRVVQESLRTTPVPRCTLESDFYGNPMRRILAPRGFFTFDFTATIEHTNTPDWTEIDVSDPGIDLLQLFEFAAENLLYTQPSRYCPSDILQRMAQDKFGSIKGVGAQVAAVGEWVQNRIRHDADRDTLLQSAAEVVTNRIGGRRDRAHLIIAFCRALGIPARYVSGYALGLEPQDFTGWAQVYIGDRWHDVETEGNKRGRNRPILVPIATGRDAADVTLFQSWGHSIFRARSVHIERL